MLSLLRESDGVGCSCQREVAESPKVMRGIPLSKLNVAVARYTDLSCVAVLLPRHKDVVYWMGILPPGYTVLSVECCLNASEEGTPPTVLSGEPSLFAYLPTLISSIKRHFHPQLSFIFVPPGNGSAAIELSVLYAATISSCRLGCTYECNPLGFNV